MNEQRTDGLLGRLGALGKIDSARARVDAEIRAAKADFDAKQSVLKAAERELLSREQLLKEKRMRYATEEREVRGETERLTNRRKALSSFSNYKVQQGADREIEHAAKLLVAREDALLVMMEEIDAFQKGVEQALRAKEQAAMEFEERVKVNIDELETLEARRVRLLEERKEWAQKVEPRSLQVYERVYQRFPVDPVVAVRNQACSACFMQIGPKIISEILAGQTITRCPGCNRIIYIEEKKEE